MPGDANPINIDAAGQRQRRVMGVVALVAAVALALYISLTDAPRVARLVVFVPVFACALGFLQARHQTCVVLAARNARDVGQGIQAVSDPAEARRLRATGLRVFLLSTGIAVAVTAAFSLLLL
jgi:hypothetical protein